MAASRKPTALGVPVPPPPAGSAATAPPLPAAPSDAKVDGSKPEVAKTTASRAPTPPVVPQAPAAAPAAAARPPTKPPIDMDGPPTVDDEIPGENTTIDSSMSDRLVKVADPEERWEESTVAEKGSAKRSMGAPHAMAVGSAEAKPAPDPRPDDSARVLVDFDDPKANTTVDEGAISQMPTAISPNALVAQTRPTAAISRLVVIGGNDRGREFVLTNAETTLGRGADNDIILTDIAVSRRHVILINDGVRYGVRDLSSGNGTLVNGVRITGDVFIHDGDQLELGNTLLRFEHPGARSAVTSPPVGPPLGPPGAGLPPAALPGPPPPVVLAAPPPPPGLVAQPPLPGLPLAPPVPTAGTGLPVAGPPPPYPPPSGMYAATSPPYSPLPTPFVPPNQGPSAAAMDLFRSQRKLLLWVGGGLAGFALIAIIAVVSSSSPKKDGGLKSTEAQTSPALNALLADVDNPKAPGGPMVSPAPSPAPTPAPVAPAPAPPGPTTAPVVEPAGPAVASLPPPRPEAKKPAPEPKRPPPEPKKPPPRRVEPAEKPKPEKGGSAAERQALALYKDKQYARASEVLQTAAAKESGATAEKLEAQARDLAAVGVAIAKGDANAAQNPTVAFTAYQQALGLDARSGKGTHAAYIRGQLAKVTPRAATAYFAAGKLEQARAACDAAEGYGVGDDPAIARVRASLETKAKDLYNQGVALAKKSPDEAKALWRRVLKIVPAESAWYTKSYAALNKVTKSKTEDEDE
jgi:hypothetical protein